MTRLALEGVTVRRAKRTVLDEVTLDFGMGLTAVIGPNGAGKSTLIAAAAGLLPLATGIVTIDGESLARIGRRRLAAMRAYLPQSPRIDWPISVERVVALGLTPSLPAFGGLPQRLADAVAITLAECDLIDLRDRQATALSGGELARTMLARAIVGRPRLLLVDEPTAGLDPRHALDAARRLRAQADNGAVVIAALHDLDLALRFATHIVAVRHGRVLAAGAACAVLTEPLLEALYDVPARLVETGDGMVVRFGGA